MRNTIFEGLRHMGIAILLLLLMVLAGCVIIVVILWILACGMLPIMAIAEGEYYWFYLWVPMILASFYLLGRASCKNPAE